jgi:hypothetical protein
MVTSLTMMIVSPEVGNEAHSYLAMVPRNSDTVPVSLGQHPPAHQNMNRTIEKSSSSAALPRVR